jgi:hypothetical protein
MITYQSYISMISPLLLGTLLLQLLWKAYLKLRQGINCFIPPEFSQYDPLGLPENCAAGFKQINPCSIGLLRSCQKFSGSPASMCCIFICRMNDICPFISLQCRKGRAGGRGEDGGQEQTRSDKPTCTRCTRTDLGDGFVRTSSIRDTG